jgi:hypothetical protein
MCRLKPVFLILISFLAAGFVVAEEDRPEHFKGLPADTLVQAVANFSEYNSKLEGIIQQEHLTPQEMHEVHMLTYTLENALAKIHAELAELAEPLEAVHLASERSDPETVKIQGQAYLDNARQIIK